jgi:hypothetical protein
MARRNDRWGYDSRRYADEHSQSTATYSTGQPGFFTSILGGCGVVDPETARKGRYDKDRRSKHRHSSYEDDDDDETDDSSTYYKPRRPKTAPRPFVQSRPMMYNGHGYMPAPMYGAPGYPVAPITHMIPQTYPPPQIQRPHSSYGEMNRRPSTRREKVRSFSDSSSDSSSSAETFEKRTSRRRKKRKSSKKEKKRGSKKDRDKGKRKSKRKGKRDSRNETSGRREGDSELREIVTSQQPMTEELLSRIHQLQLSPPSSSPQLQLVNSHHNSLGAKQMKTPGPEFHIDEHHIQNLQNHSPLQNSPYPKDIMGGPDMIETVSAVSMTGVSKHPNPLSPGHNTNTSSQFLPPPTTFTRSTSSRVKVMSNGMLNNTNLMVSKVPPGNVALSLRSVNMGLLIDRVSDRSVAKDLNEGDIIVALDGVDVRNVLCKIQKLFSQPIE